MAQELVWAKVDGGQAAVSRAYAEKNGLEVLDESPRDHNGDVRRPTRANGRPRKKKVSVAEAADGKAAPVNGPESASTKEEE